MGQNGQALEIDGPRVVRLGPWRWWGATARRLGLALLLLVVGVGMGVPFWHHLKAKKAREGDLKSVRAMLIACHSFAADWDGLFPSFDPDSEGDTGPEVTSSSTQPFNVLIPQYIDTESIFWYPTPSKPRPPKEDGNLTPPECTYGYVCGQTNTSFSRMPLIAQEMESPGWYGADHPLLSERVAIIGLVGGSVEAWPLVWEWNAEMGRVMSKVAAPRLPDDGGIFVREKPGIESPNKGVMGPGLVLP